MGEDNESVLFCDIDMVIDTEGNEDDMYHSTECLQPLTGRTALWAILYIKKEERRGQYITARQKAGLPVEGYDGLEHTLSVVEIDAAKRQCRIIPATDRDRFDQELGDSSLLSGEGGIPIQGLSREWNPVGSRKVHKGLRAAYRFLYPQ
jgi:hypothetical protein